MPVFEYIVLVLDGNSEIGLHVTNNLYYLSCLRHLIRSRAVTYRNCENQKRQRPIFLYACATCYELPPNLSTMNMTGIRSGIFLSRRRSLFLHKIVQFKKKSNLCNTLKNRPKSDYLTILKSNSELSLV